MSWLKKLFTRRDGLDILDDLRTIQEELYDHVALGQAEYNPASIPRDKVFIYLSEVIKSRGAPARYHEVIRHMMDYESVDRAQLLDVLELVDDAVTKIMVEEGKNGEIDVYGDFEPLPRAKKDTYAACLEGLDEQLNVRGSLVVGLDDIDRGDPRRTFRFIRTALDLVELRSHTCRYRVTLAKIKNRVRFEHDTTGRELSSLGIAIKSCPYRLGG